MSVLAVKCPGVRVCVVDLSVDQIEAWKSDNLPVYEPGLLEVHTLCVDVCKKVNEKSISDALSVIAIGCQVCSWKEPILFHRY